MGTKNNPGIFDCYAAALPDEPLFILLARDRSFPEVVEFWADTRQMEVDRGFRLDKENIDTQKINEAQKIATDGVRWRRANHGIWRKTNG